MKLDADQLQPMIGHVVVIDVEAPFVYLGTLRDANDSFFVLGDADVHDLRDSDATRELYVLSSARDGVRRNRMEVRVRSASVLSISKLGDVVDH